jgi:hypothetical protein
MKAACGLLFLFVFLISCQAMPIQAPMMTPESEKWMKYEQALALATLNSTDAKCEWLVHGQSNQEVYVWAICRLDNAHGKSLKSVSVPAVVILGHDGDIDSVLVPYDGEDFSHFAREHIPPAIQEEMFNQSGSDIDAMWAHLFSRQKNPEPPYIVIWKTPLP